jgi:hypothetical protein
VVVHLAGGDPITSLERAADLRAQPRKLIGIAREVRTRHSFAVRARELLNRLKGQG